MIHQSKGHSTGGAWYVSLDGNSFVFENKNGFFPDLDQFYLPIHDPPRSFRDFYCELREGGEAAWIALLHNEAPQLRVPTFASTPFAEFQQNAHSLAASTPDCNSPTVAAFAIAHHPTPLADRVPLPFADSDEYLSRLAATRGLPERNMEDMVKELLIRLGHPAGSIAFQIGRIDISILDKQRRTIMVLEVKTSIAGKSNRDAAIRQAQDYAARTGARFFVISDSDRYEIYDRTKGLLLDDMKCCAFQLTAMKESDLSYLNLLSFDHVSKL